MIKKIKNLILLSLLALVLVVSGCSSGTDSKGSNFGTGSSTGGSGNSGIELSFANGNPPSEMFKGQPYTFAFVIKNFQEHEINDLEIRTKGFDRGYVSGLAESYSVNTLPKASTQIGPGLFSGLIVQGVTVDGFTGNFNFNPEFDMCYSAKTNFREQICVPSTSNTCDVDVSKSQYSNGPVNVKVNHINALGSTIRIDFEVSNSGKGNVVNSCFSSQEYASSYQVKATLGTANGNCMPAGTNEFLIAGNKGSFYCEFQRTSDSSYASQLSVELDYIYQQTLKKQISVRDLNQGFN